MAVEEIRRIARKLNVFVNKNLAVYTESDKDTRQLIKRCKSVDELYDYLKSMENGSKDFKLEFDRLDSSTLDKELVRRYSRTYDPFDHQARYFYLSKDKKVFANFCEMGTGKTIMEIMVASYLYEKDEINALVIVAPNGIHRQWINTAIPEHMPARINPITAIWSSSANKAEKIDLDGIFVRNNGLKILSMNVEALGSPSDRAYDYLEMFIEKHKCMIIIDESTRIKNPKAKRTKALLKLCNGCEYRRILSGLYIPNGPLDLYSQFYFLDPKILGYSSYVTFKSRYAIEVNPRLKRDLEIAVGDKILAEKIYNERRVKYITPSRLKEILTLNGKEGEFSMTWDLLKKSFLFITGYKNTNELSDKLKPHSYRVLKEECIDLPEKLFKQYETELSKEQKRAYDEIENVLITEINGREVTTQHVLTKLGMLRQICGGTYRYEDEASGKVMAGVIEGKIPRLELLVEILGDIRQEEKVIIWSVYRQEIEIISKRIEAEFGKESLVQIHGDITGQDREDNFQRFQDDPECRFLVGTAKSGGIGRNLTAGSYMIFYSNSMELEERRQAEDREHRIGQKRNVTIIDIINKDLIDDKIFNCLINKQKIADMITQDPMSWKPRG